MIKFADWFAEHFRPAPGKKTRLSTIDRAWRASIDDPYLRDLWTIAQTRQQVEALGYPCGRGSGGYCYCGNVQPITDPVPMPHYVATPENILRLVY